MRFPRKASSALGKKGMYDEQEEEEEDEDDMDDSEGSEEGEENIDEEYIKKLNLTLANDELNVKIPYEEIDVGDESYEESNNLESNNLADFESTLEETDIYLSHEDHMSTTNELKHDEDFLKNVSITDFGEGTISLGEIEDIHTSKSDYKKLSLNKLREVVVSKGVIADASKLKKNDILKLLGDE